MTTLLVAHPDPITVRETARALTDWGYQVKSTAEPGSVPFLARQHAPDLVIMGHHTEEETATACRLLRDWSRVPIIVLTTLELVPDQLVAAGAEWGVHPRAGRRTLKHAVWLALETVFVRQVLHNYPVLALGRCLFCHVRQVIALKDGVIPLTSIETELFAALAKRPGEVVPHHRLVAAGWPDRPLLARRQRMQLHIHNLRKKLATGGPDAPRIVLSVFNGYRLVLPQDAEVFELPFAA